MDESREPCPGGRVVERNRYFTGKLMGVADFQAEQEYFLDRSRAHNRLHGFGTVCGLAVIPTDPPSGAVVVEPGVALDCCGREIIVTDPLVVDVAELAAKSTHAGRVLVTVRYDEEEAGLVPVIVDDGEETAEPGRLREVPRFEVVAEHPRGVIIGDEHDGVAPCPECVEAAVTLARIDLSTGGRLAPDQIDNSVRRDARTGASHRAAIRGRFGDEDPSDQVDRLERRVRALSGAVALLTAVTAWSLRCRR
jgi:hypothetical protein